MGCKRSGFTSQHANSVVLCCNRSKSSLGHVAVSAVYDSISTVYTSDVFRISVRRGRRAVGVDGVGRGVGGWAPFPEKKYFFVPKMIALGAL